MAVPYLACMLLTAHFYGLPPRVLPTIQAVEGGRTGMVNANTNGTADLGVMQINTAWIPAIAEVAHQTPAMVAARLIHDPCFSIAAGGAILQAYRREAHGNLMVAIGYYHSHTAPLNEAYQALVLNRAATMFASAGG